MKKEINELVEGNLQRWCPTSWPPRFGCLLAAGALVRIHHIDMDSTGQYAYVRSRRHRAATIHKVPMEQLHAPTTTTPLYNSGCANCKASCPIIGKRLTQYRLRIYPSRMRMPQITPAVKEWFAQMGRIGGRKKTAKKMASIAKARAVRAVRVLARQNARKNLIKEIA